MARSNALLTAPQVDQKKRTEGRRFFSSDNPWFWVLPATAILLAYSIFPLLYNIYLSFFRWRQSEKAFVPHGFENWTDLLTNADGRFYDALVLTIQYTIIALVVQLTLGLLIALLLDAKPWGSGLMQTIMILPMVTAPAVAGLMFRLLQHSEYGAISWIAYSLNILTNDEPLLGGTGRYALFAVVLVDIWQWTPFFTLIILAGLKGIPGEVIEASEVDGATWWQRLTRIKIPLLFGVITVGVLFRLVDLYKIFDYVVIMTNQLTETLAYYNYVYTFQQTRWGFGAAIGVFIMLVGWITAFVYTRVFRVRF
jgi:multiple sugar transport system permease protein